MTYLSGQVLFHDGKPLQWVGVVLDPKTENQSITLTNSDGKFAFQTTPGKHTLAVRSFALQPFTKIIDIPNSGLNSLKIDLKSSLRMLDYPSSRK